MTQIILDVTGSAIYLPESRGYRAWKEDGGAEVEMISRRLVRELRGNVWRVTYQHGWFNDATRPLVLDCCVRGKKHPIDCAILPPDSNEMITSSFFVVDYTSPTFYWSRVVTEDGEEKTVPMWANFAIELREVRAHD